MIKASHVRLNGTDADIFDDKDDAAVGENTKRIATKGTQMQCGAGKLVGLLAVSKVVLFLMSLLRR